MTKTIFDINEAQMSETKSTYTLTEIPVFRSYHYVFQDFFLTKY